MDLNALRLDLNAVSGGVWHEMDENTKLLIAQVPNPRFTKRFQELTANYRGTAGKKKLSNEKAEEILVACLAETVLLGWEGLTENGVEVIYSSDKAKAILGDPTLIEFRKEIVKFAEDASNYRAEEIEEASGKSKPSSSGISNGATKKISSKAS